MDSHQHAAARSQRVVRIDSRIPARLLEPQAVDLGKTVADEVVWTKVALLQGTLRNKDVEVAEVETERSQEAREKEEAQTAQWQSWRSHLLSRS